VKKFPAIFFSVAVDCDSGLDQIESMAGHEIS
jgi:hypothetical protein